MAEQAREQTTINAPVEQCFRTLIDFESYPEWAGDLKQATVVAYDDEERAAGGGVPGRGHGPQHDLPPAVRLRPGAQPAGLGAAERRPRARARRRTTSSPTGAEPGTTDVVYELSVDLIVPIPGFVKRRAEARIIKTALSELKARVEGVPAAPDSDDDD